MSAAISYITGIFRYEELPINYQNILTVILEEYGSLTDACLREIADGVAFNLKGGKQ